jgi:Holliday junction resolvase RusA-like endonuclease
MLQTCFAAAASAYVLDAASILSHPSFAADTTINPRRPTMTSVLVEDIMTMESHGYQTVKFDVRGNLQAQERPRMVWKNRTRFPRFYDPSAKAKKIWKKALKKALDDIGMGSALPLFGAEGQQQPIQVELTFFWPHPDQKDLDNMIKFVLDAYEGLLYGNDKKIYEITSKKAYAASSWMEAKFTMVVNPPIIGVFA